MSLQKYRGKAIDCVLEKNRKTEIVPTFRPIHPFKSMCIVTRACVLEHECQHVSVGINTNTGMLHHLSMTRPDPIPFIDAWFPCRMSRKCCGVTS